MKYIYIYVCVLERKNEQSKLDNSETFATLGTQNTYI